MQWVYLSPHPDDAALSCGGLIWEQAHSGEGAGIWTICAGGPPEAPLSPFAEALHDRWGTGREASAQRRKEDLESCAILGAVPRHFPIPDCIYRRSPRDGAALYASEEAIFGPIHPDEATLLEQLADDLEQDLAPGTSLVCPLALGGHVDHRLVRAALEKTGRKLWYYADYPYVLKTGISSDFLVQPGCEAKLFPISAAALTAWVGSIAAHGSQISTFWPDLASMQAAIAGYCAAQGGLRLWRI